MFKCWTCMTSYKILELIWIFNKGSRNLRVEWLRKKNLKILRKVLVPHREIHSALEPLVSGVHDFPRETIQSLLYVQIFLRIVQIFKSQSFSHTTKINHHRHHFQTTTNPNIWIIILIIHKHLSIRIVGDGERDRETDRNCGGAERRSSCVAWRTSSC